MSNGGGFLDAVKDFFSDEPTPEEKELERAGEAVTRAEEHLGNTRAQLDKMLEALGEMIGGAAGETPAKIHRVLERAVVKMDKIEEKLAAVKKAERAVHDAEILEDGAQTAVDAARTKEG